MTPQEWRSIWEPSRTYLDMRREYEPGAGMPAGEALEASEEVVGRIDDNSGLSLEEKFLSCGAPGTVGGEKLASGTCGVCETYHAELRIRPMASPRPASVRETHLADCSVCHAPIYLRLRG